MQRQVFGRVFSVFVALCLLSVSLLSSCKRHAVGEQVRVAVTTSIVCDVVREVGGDDVTVTMLFPFGADPHTFEPTPMEMAALFGTQTVFVNGGGLEAFIDPLLESVGVPIVSVSDGISLRTFAPGSDEQGTDPHVWFDPANLIIWAENIARTLARLDPEHEDGYVSGALRYEQTLRDLDAWIASEVATIPQESRTLVTDHEDFAYFASRYGFELVGAVIPSSSTLVEPSAQGLATLEAAIRDRGVRAVFAGTTVNPILAEQVAKDTGIRIEFLYTGALTAPGGPASTYLELMRYDVQTIIRALTAGP